METLQVRDCSSWAKFTPRQHIHRGKLATQLALHAGRHHRGSGLTWSSGLSLSTLGHISALPRLGFTWSQSQTHKAVNIVSVLYGAQQPLVDSANTT
jgi:hypothetical protein